MGRLAGQAPEAAARREALPAAPLAARARAARWGPPPCGRSRRRSPTPPAPRGPPAMIPPPMPVPSVTMHGVGGAGGGAEGPLRHRGAGGVVVDDGPQARRGAPRGGRRCRARAPGQVGGEAQHPGVVDQAGRPHPDRRPPRRRRRPRSCSATDARASMTSSDPSTAVGGAARRAAPPGVGHPRPRPAPRPRRRRPGRAPWCPPRRSRSSPARPRRPPVREPGGRRRRRGHVVSEDSTARLELLEGGVHDAALGPALDEPGQRDPQLDLEGVGHLGRAVARRLEAVAPVELGGEVAGGLLPGQGPGRLRVVVGEGVARGAAEGPGTEGGLGRAPLVVAAARRRPA